MQSKHTLLMFSTAVVFLLIIIPAVRAQTLWDWVKSLISPPSEEAVTGGPSPAGGGSAAVSYDNCVLDGVAQSPNAQYVCPGEAISVSTTGGHFDNLHTACYISDTICSYRDLSNVYHCCEGQRCEFSNVDNPQVQYSDNIVCASEGKSCHAKVSCSGKAGKATATIRVKCRLAWYCGTWPFLTYGCGNDNARDFTWSVYECCKNADCGQFGQCDVANHKCILPSCTISANPSSGTGQFSSVLTATFTNLPSTVTQSFMKCKESDTGVNVQITNNKSEFSCIYPEVSQTTTYTASASLQSSGAALCSVKVTDNPKPQCVRSYPTVLITPSSKQGTAGSTLSYVVNMQNKDGSACSPSTFTLSVTQCPSGFNCVLTSTSLTINPGSPSSTDIKVTSPSTASEGSNTFKVKAENSQATSYYAEASGTYEVVKGAVCQFALNSLTLDPSLVTSCPSSVTAKITYSSSNCGSKTVSVRKGSCSGTEVAKIDTSDSLTSNSKSFQVSSNNDTANYYACYDSQEKSAPLSVSCPTATTTTSITTTTSTTTTISTTTTTISNVTTTTTTLPTGIQCDECFAGSKCKCTLMTGCNDGIWVLQNKEGSPLDSMINPQIPPSTVEFNTKATGKITIRAFCFGGAGGELVLNVENAFLSCDDECAVNQNCQCSVSGCSDGSFSAVLGNTVLKWEDKISTTSYSVSFIPEKVGTVNVEVRCNSPDRDAATTIPVTGEEVEPGKKFSGSNFRSQKIENYHKVRVDYVNNYADGVIIVFTLSKGGEAKNKQVTVDYGKGTASVNFNCDDLNLRGSYTISWKAFKSSDKENPVAWSKVDDMVSVEC